MDGARRARLVALVASLLTALVVVALSSSGSPADAAPLQECPSSTTQGQICASTTSSTTSTPVPSTTSTTVPSTTSSTVIRTTSTRGQTAATAERVATTTTTTLGVATSIDVLIPGDGTEGAESTTTTTETPTTVSDGDGTSDAALLGVIVGGLLVLAVAVGILTWRYWVATRPPLLPAVGSDHG
jgi:hypothetical protein